MRDALKDGIEYEMAAPEKAIQRANETGELRPAREAEQTAFELHSILMNTHALWQVRQDPEVFRHARAAIRRLVG